jgi:hypothetical protein
MPDEEIDKIIRDAAGQHHPPYDDSAWGKMEVLLDKHLPQKKDRKKPIVFLLAFLLLGCAVFFAVKNYRNTNPSSVIENKQTGSLPKTAAKDVTGSSNSTTGTTAVETNSNNNQLANDLLNKDKQTATTTKADKTSQTNASASITGEANDKWNGHNKKGNNQKGRLAIKIKNATATGDDDNRENILQATADNKDVVTVADGTETPVSVNNDAVENEITNKDETVSTEKKDSSIAAIKPGSEKKNNEKDSAINKTAKQKDRKPILSKLALTLSAGKDVSYIDIKNAGKLKPIYGAGLSYDLGKHFIVSTGLNVSKKVYYAAPQQYKFPAGSSVSPYLSKIDAACKIYEIPLNVYYNFMPVKKHSWFAGAGISSFIMKTEDYNYIYQYPGGQTYNYTHSIADENKHYFSVLTLSGGYQYKLSKIISLKAEPYLKIPVIGVGAGKVKLNSAGLLITGAVKPFGKRK